VKGLKKRGKRKFKGGPAGNPKKVTFKNTNVDSNTRVGERDSAQFKVDWSTFSFN